MTAWNRRLVGCLVAFAVGVTAVGVTGQPPKPEKKADPVKPAEFVAEGKVMDESGKKPMPGVKVWASAGAGTLMVGGETTTDKDGKFRLTFGPGLWVEGGHVGGLVAIVHAQKPGWYAWTYGWPAAYQLRDEPPGKDERPPKGWDFLHKGEVTRLEFRMAPAAAVRVRVVDGAGKPITDTSLWLAPKEPFPGGSVYAQGKTDANGVWTAVDIPRGQLRLSLGDKTDFRRERVLGEIHFKGAAEYTAEVTVREWTDTATDIRFQYARGKSLTPP